jgi:hypothetical protein
MGEWRCISTILDLDSTWRRVVNFTPRSPSPLNGALLCDWREREREIMRERE